MSWGMAVRFSAAATFLSHLQSLVIASVTYPASYSGSTGGFVREAMWLGREADHSSSSSTKVKWAITSTFSHAIMACIRISVRGQIQRLCHCFRSTNWNYLVAWRWIPRKDSRKALWVNETWRCQLVGSDCGIAERFNFLGDFTLCRLGSTVVEFDLGGLVSAGREEVYDQ